MKVIIVEDEIPAAEKLERYLQKYSADVEVLARLQTINDTVEWLLNHQEKIDLIFMDVQLSDGLSFQIFRLVAVHKPVIFTTAYNEFTLDAFKVSGIDYLLKPVTFTDLAASLNKFFTLREQFQKGDGIVRLQKAFQDDKYRTYKTRFMVKLGEHIRSVTTDQINVFYAEGRDVYLVTNQGRKFIIDYTLESLEDVLDPAIFFRLNRTFILNINGIKDVLVYSNSRLKVTLHTDVGKEVVVSREKVNEFKEWFGGK